MMKEYKTIEKVTKNILCTGCATCISLCPCSAIELTEDSSKGVYLPLIREEKCKKCGTCYKVCPGHEVDFKNLNLDIFGSELEDGLIGSYLNCFVGHAAEYSIRYNSASGGLITCLLIFALERGIIDGALVTRMSIDNPLRPEPFIARTREEIIFASGSKYCPVPANVALKDMLFQEGKYAVVGLPCHIHGIRKAEAVNKKLKDRTVLELGIFCGGGISFLGTDFWLKRIGISKEMVEKIDYRGEGWPGSMTIQLKNNKKKSSYLYYYNRGFNSFVPWRCTLCWDRTAELADISFGDAWLPEFRNDNVGSSIIISRTRRGEDILQRMMDENIVNLDSVSRDKVLASQRGYLWEKRETKLRFRISRILGREVPNYHNNDLLLKCSLSAYLNGSLFYLRRFLVTKVKLIWILYTMNVLIKCGGCIKRFRLKLFTRKIRGSDLV